MILVKPPFKFEEYDQKIWIFLAGTIDMGNSEDWQKKVEYFFKDNDDVVIFNPRRDNWDSSWEQKITNPQFKEQVEGELNYLDNSDIIIFNFLPDSKSPVTMLELGLHVKDNIYVCCPDDFYRSGNIHIICERYNIPLFKNLDELLINIFEKNL